MTTLYLCYQSITDPLTRTQVVAYLQGLSAHGNRVLLVTFEPRRLSDTELEAVNAELLMSGIEWQTRRYHKRWSVLSTAWDIVVGSAAVLSLHWRYGVDVVHCRAHVPGLMALLVKPFTKASLLFDIRGLMAEEYADAGVWRDGGVLFALTKRAERWLVRHCDAIVMLTERGAQLLAAQYGSDFSSKPLEIIPCCVDSSLYATPAARRDGEATVLTYVGKLGGWYWDEALIRFAIAFGRQRPGTEVRVFTQSPTADFHQMAVAAGLHAVSFAKVKHTDVPNVLHHAHAGLGLILPCRSKVASSPTKIGEYLAAGLPVVSTAGIGDLDSLLRDVTGELGGPVGVIVDPSRPDGYDTAATELIRLLDDPGIHNRCRLAASRLLDLREVGWVRYARLYDRIARARARDPQQPVIRVG